jgi:hypothetical protein
VHSQSSCLHLMMAENRQPRELLCMMPCCAQHATAPSTQDMVFGGTDHGVDTHPLSRCRMVCHQAAPA